ncbi:MAG: orotidine-5'-phosphate decarboxylase [Chloroflexi bacterium]|nr:orotidine-5'-phosphate decarboxylase [Chloroflexota bacterium]
MSHRPRPAADQSEALSDSIDPPDFSARLWAQAEAKQSWVCLGLDVLLRQLPRNIPHTVEGAERFLRNIVDASVEDVSAFKPNLAFYLAMGSDGIRLLTDIIEHIDHRAIVILDGKFGDVSDTMEQYARAAFDEFDADAVTVDVYGGWETVDPMLGDPTRGVFVWARSSNPDADAVQGGSRDADPLFVRLAGEIQSRAESGNLGAVVGATRAVDVRRVRAAAPTVPLLAPGVGAQGGDLESVVRAGFGDAPAGVLINAGRSALWASADGDYVLATRAAVQELRDRINVARST